MPVLHKCYVYARLFLTEDNALFNLISLRTSNPARFRVVRRYNLIGEY